jgi:hypothetical protein
MAAATAVGQPTFSQPHGLYDGGSLTVAIAGREGAVIRYTTDGSTPTAQSTLYTAPLTVAKTTILRAVEVFPDSVSKVATASYIFVSSVLSQPNNPAGYPAQWGSYTQEWGTATADYEMDPEMTGNPTLRPKIIEGLKSLPIMSIVTDRGNLFNREADEATGGIYIFTGPPAGDATGHGWTRPASVELFQWSEQGGAPAMEGDILDHSTTCGLRLHGGHGRLAEKNPKHSFRLVFKEKYGPKTMKYPLYGAGEPKKFDQLVLRCHFGNAWQHWAEDNRRKAQYTRDVWARRMQRRISGLAVNARYVHLFLNGMYWGMYNVSERVDAQYGQSHLGGKEEDIDVIKVEEDGGNHIEASEGTLDAWRQMTQTVQQAAYDNEAYAALDTLLDIPQFIDYMLINQYGGNTDWAHHNWYAIRRRGNDSTASTGFRFLCWDSEIIFVGENENNLSKDDGLESPTGIFQRLLRNETFARRYVRRAKELLQDDGLLGQSSVVELWDSLYNTVHMALYDEAARWGDYRRDVHPWQSRGQLYTVDNHYMAERNRLLNQYFPYRTDRVLNQVLAYVRVDDFEAPADWEPLLASMWHQWNGTGAAAQVTVDDPGAELNLRANVGGGGVVAGFSSVSYNLYADVSRYDRLVLRGSGSRIRILANRLTDHGVYKQIVVSLNSSDPYWDSELQAVVLPLSDLATSPTNQGEARRDAFVHINAIKVESGSSATISGLWLVPADTPSAIFATNSTDGNTGTGGRDDAYYSLDGRRVLNPTKGVYVRSGKKIILK